MEANCCAVAGEPDGPSPVTKKGYQCRNRVFDQKIFTGNSGGDSLVLRGQKIMLHVDLFSAIMTVPYAPRVDAMTKSVYAFFLLN